MKKRFSFILALLLIIMLFTGCAAKSYSQNTVAAPEEYNASAKVASYDTAYTEERSEEKMYKEDSLNPTVPNTAALPENVKLIYRAGIDMETVLFDQAVETLSKLVGEVGGYFENSSLNNYSSYRHAYYTVRVPAEKFEEFISRIGGNCQVNNISRSAEDISESYYDTEARLETQKTKLKRLQELLAQAESMDDIITIESAISETEFMIEELTGTIRRYDSLVGYSTIDISISEVYRLSGTEEPAIGFGAKLLAAFKTGCENFNRNLQYSLLDFARNWVGWLLFFVIAAIIIIVVVRTVRRRRRGKEEKRKLKSEAENKIEK